MLTGMSDLGVGTGAAHKVLLVGDAAVGKTCIIRRFVHNVFQVGTKSTIGIDFAMKMVHCKDGEPVTLQVWDIAGQERCGQMTRVYYQAAVGALVVFDLARRASLDAAVRWKADLDSKVALESGDPIPCVLVANKCDLAPLPTVMAPAELDQFCADHGFVGWVEASAKRNIGVGAAFRRLVEQVRANEKLMSCGGFAACRQETDIVQIAARMEGHADARGGRRKKCACTS